MMTSASAPAKVILFGEHFVVHHGTYSIRFCQKYLQLCATVIDHPLALQAASENISVEKMDGRIALQPGNYLTDDFGKGHNVALLFNIVHAHTQEENIGLMSKVADTLEKGGQVAVLDAFSDKSELPTVKSLVRLFDLTFFSCFGGQVYGSTDIKKWLAAAGFTHIRVTSLRNTPGARLIIGKKA